MFQWAEQKGTVPGIGMSPMVMIKLANMARTSETLSISLGLYLYIYIYIYTSSIYIISIYIHPYLPIIYLAIYLPFCLYICFPNLFVVKVSAISWRACHYNWFSKYSYVNLDRIFRKDTNVWTPRIKNQIQPSKMKYCDYHKRSHNCDYHKRSHNFTKVNNSSM